MLVYYVYKLLFHAFRLGFLLLSKGSSLIWKSFLFAWFCICLISTTHFCERSTCSCEENLPISRHFTSKGVSPWPWPKGKLTPSLLLNTVAFMADQGVNLRNAILMDTGCSQHMFRDSSSFKNLRMFSQEEATSLSIQGIGTTVLQPIGEGDVTLTLYVQGEKRLLTLGRTLLVPELQTNLISGSQLIVAGCRIQLDKDGSFVYNPENENGNRHIITETVRYSGLFFINAYDDHETALASYSSFDNPSKQLWHERLGHLSEEGMKRLEKIAKGIDLNHIPSIEGCICEACARGRMRDVSHRDTIAQCTTPFETIFTDIEGPIAIPGYEGSRYFVTFMDAATKESEVYFMKFKAEMASHFAHYNAMKEKRGHKILRLHSDGGGEYLAPTFQQELKDAGIDFTYSAPYSQQQNGAAERLNQTLVDKAFSLRLDSALPENYWVEAIKWANWLRNRSIVASLRTADGLDHTPYEMATGKTTDHTFTRKFGCDVFYRPGSQKKYRNLVDEKGKPGLFVGFDKSRHIIRIRDKETGRLIRASVVRFDESRSTKLHENKRRRLDSLSSDESDDEEERPHTWARWDEIDPTILVQALRESRRLHKKGEKLAKIRVVTPAQRQPSEKETNPDNSDSSLSDCPSPTPEPRKSAREKKTPERFRRINPAEHDLKTQKKYASLAAYLAAPPPTQHTTLGLLAQKQPDDLYEPRGYSAAKRHHESEKWMIAADDEYKSLIENETWDLVPRSKKQHVLPAAWVFTYKKDILGNILKYKARWVARGDKQIEGIDYHETFASVVKTQ